ncbi:hypothetical protein A2U01_0094760, partial [Trifolium medium]|nr:hypothetical protein [Trifolium medium]
AKIGRILRIILTSSSCWIVHCNDEWIGLFAIALLRNFKDSVGV